VSAANDLAALYAGLLYPLLTPTHALGLVALGLLIIQQAAGHRRLLQIVVVLALAGALTALALAVGETPASEVLLAVTAINGALVAAAYPLPLWLIGPLGAAVGAAIGLDSPPEVISLEEATVMLVGTLIGAVLVLALVVAIASRMLRDWQRIGVRVLGSWAAASALLALAVRFAAK
jgi:urease accessory protein